MARKSTANPIPAPRSGCPLSCALDLLGDRWSLLLIRDMMVRGLSTFRQFQNSGEGIATNILSSRLRSLEAGGIVQAEPSADDGRSIRYRLTEKGIALAPVLFELLIWGAHHGESGAPCATIDHLEKNRAAVLAEALRRWKERDPEPLIPPFGPAGRNARLNLTKGKLPS